MEIIVCILRVVPVPQPSSPYVNPLVVVIRVLWRDLVLKIDLVWNAGDVFVVIRLRGRPEAEDSKRSGKEAWQRRQRKGRTVFTMRTFSCALH